MKKRGLPKTKHKKTKQNSKKIKIEIKNNHTPQQSGPQKNATSKQKN